MRWSPAPPPLRFVPKEKQWFAYECQAGLFNPKVFLVSLLGHIAVLFWFPSLTSGVTVLRAMEQADSHELTLIYAPTLPEIRSSSEPSRSRDRGSQGARQKSPRETIRAISSNEEPTPVLVQSMAAATHDASVLASLIPISSSGKVTLAPQPIEIASDIKKETQPPLISLEKLKGKMPLLPSNQTLAKLAPQPIEIASGPRSSALEEPALLPLNAIPTADPKLPIVQANVKVREAKFIPAGTRALRTSAGSGPPSPAGLQGLAAPGSGGGIPNGILATTGSAVVLNPPGGSVVGSAANQQGRLAAHPDGVQSGRGLGDSGGGTSNDGDQGNDPGARGVGPKGNGNVSIETEPGAGSSASGSSPVAIEGGVIDLGSFGPAASGPLHGRRPAIVVVSSAGAGGALQQFASALHGKIYTVYLNTSGTTGVMQFSETRQGTRELLFTGDLTPPESISTPIPKDLRTLHQVVACVLTTDGRLKNIKLLSDVGGNTAERFTQALEHWLFRPAYKDDKPVAVDVLLGFSVDTN
jgi:hypothetical protein